MSYMVEISQRATRDILRNANWWAAHHSLKQASKWETAIYKKMGSLAERPESNALAYENDEFSYELREALFGLGSRPGYRILYRIDDNVVRVLAVKAAQENWTRDTELDK